MGDPQGASGRPSSIYFAGRCQGMRDAVSAYGDVQLFLDRRSGATLEQIDGQLGLFGRRLLRLYGDAKAARSKMRKAGGLASSPPGNEFLDGYLEALAHAESLLGIVIDSGEPEQDPDAWRGLVHRLTNALRDALHFAESQNSKETTSHD